MWMSMCMWICLWMLKDGDVYVDVERCVCVFGCGCVCGGSQKN